MQQPLLESRPLYGIGTVARLTGLKPDTLRAWERRYGLGASQKSAAGRRQYSQSDLEHLQMVATLVRSGARIGEIASSERKTLEFLLNSQNGLAEQIAPAKPIILCIGAQLCRWLDQHQGLLANVDAKMARIPLAKAQSQLAGYLDEVDVLVAEGDSLDMKELQSLETLASQLGARTVIATHTGLSANRLKQLQERDMVVCEYPPDPAFLACEMTRHVTASATDSGTGSLGDLVEARPRQFSDQQLAQVKTLPARLDCECPQHLSELISALVKFEEYSASCSVENWRDAAVHSCIYAYTGQARWLMERALQSVLEEHEEPSSDAA